MAKSERRNCFVFNPVWLKDELDGITDAEIGFIIRSVSNYVTNGTLLTPETTDRAFNKAFRAVTRQIIAMYEKYNNYCGTRQENGSRGGRPPKNDGMMNHYEDGKYNGLTMSDLESELLNR